METSLDWLPWVSWGSAFLLGLLGSAHCFGMCGGIAGALAMGSRPGPGLIAGAAANVAQPAVKPFPMLLATGLGRISSYTVAGLLAGTLGATLGLLHLESTLRIIAALLLILLGLYLAGLSRGLAWLERGGLILWRQLQPLVHRVTPIHSLPRAVAAGAIWGWLPCGLVYSMLAWSIAQGSAFGGAGVMLAFGLGTLPAVMAAGAMASPLQHWMQRRGARLAGGLLVMLFGLWSLWGGISSRDATHTHHHAYWKVTIPSNAAPDRHPA